MLTTFHVFVSPLYIVRCELNNVFVKCINYTRLASKINFYMIINEMIITNMMIIGILIVFMTAYL